MGRARFVISCGLLLTLASALPAAGAEDPVNPRVPPAAPPAYRLGYVYGCNSGFSDAGRDGFQTQWYRSEQDYADDPDYRAGWDEGHAQCYLEEYRHPHMGIIRRH